MADIATIVGVLIALIVYITNSIQQYRHRKIENVVRFLDAHRRLFQNPFLRKNWKNFEAGSFRRNQDDAEMEKEFSALLGDIEHYALLHETKAISRTMNVYMFGWWAQRLQPLMIFTRRIRTSALSTSKSSISQTESNEKS